MSQIKHPKGPYQKTAIMTEEQERAYMDSFRDTPCESCGINDGTVVGAHLNLGLGGTGYRAKGIVAGLCVACHDLADGRTNATKEERLTVWVKVCQKRLRDGALQWLKRWLRQRG